MNFEHLMISNEYCSPEQILMLCFFNHLYTKATILASYLTHTDLAYLATFFPELFSPYRTCVSYAMPENQFRHSPVTLHT